MQRVFSVARAGWEKKGLDTGQLTGAGLCLKLFLSHCSIWSPGTAFTAYIHTARYTAGNSKSHETLTFSFFVVVVLTRRPPWGITPPRIFFVLTRKVTRGGAPGDFLPPHDLGAVPHRAQRGKSLHRTDVRTHKGVYLDCNEGCLDRLQQELPWVGVIRRCWSIH